MQSSTAENEDYVSFPPRQHDAERDHRRRARRGQLVESLGARYDEESDSAKVIASDILGIFEQFSCRDTIKDARPQVQVRTRIKTEQTRFDAKLDELAGKEE